MSRESKKQIKQPRRSLDNKWESVATGSYQWVLTNGFLQMGSNKWVLSNARLCEQGFLETFRRLFLLSSGNSLCSPLIRIVHNLECIFEERFGLPTPLLTQSQARHRLVRLNQRLSLGRG